VLVATKPQYVFNNKSNTAVVRFPHNSADLKNNVELKAVAETLAAQSELIQKINIVGHASLVGAEDVNLKISKERALSVKNILVAEGITSKIIHTDAKGESEPLINSESEEANTANRRVEFKIETKE
jgi:OOP family OmpA-OmpF porin